VTKERDRRDGVPLDATLASATALFEVRIAEAVGQRHPDEDEVTVRASGRPALPKANEDEDDGDRTTREEGTRVYTCQPGEADAQIPGVPIANDPCADPRGPATAYIFCAKRGLTPQACSFACGEVGAPCSSVAAHPFKLGKGTGQLSYCKNGGPSYTCTYTFPDGEGCTVIFVEPLGPRWLCVPPG
jgi:hypothetical protein